MNAPRKNDLITLDIDDVAYGGMGVGRAEGFVVFVERALPGERITARIVKKKQNHASAIIERIERPSPHRIAKPPCPLFGTCGGCTWQNFPHEQQAVWKRKQVADVIRHIGGLEDFEVLPTLCPPHVWRYRNKMEFTFGRNEAGETILGFHYPALFYRILHVDRCLLQPEPLDTILAILTQYARSRGLTVYNQRTHEGFLRQAVIRHSFSTGQTILILLTQDGDLPAREALAERLAREVPGFKGMLWGLNRRMADVAVIEEEAWRWGEPELTETVNGLTFRISPQSFFQTNTAGAELLYAKVVEMADLTPGSRVFDAYCGAGSIGLHCAKKAERIVGVEVIPEAIWDARNNASANGITNTTYLAAPMAQGLDLARYAAGGSFTHVIIDPPRGGMDKRSLRGLIDLQAPVFVYVSCNPATLSRDLATLAEAGYQLEAVQPVDMFPQTYHIETIVRMRMKTV